MSVHAWEKIVKQIEQESDSAKIAERAQKLNDAMVAEEKEKVKHRLGISPDKHADLGKDAQLPLTHLRTK